jgi:2,4-dienoyl-CoA reductase-like NADH-dependent reductase (Old Yellow Enzyme family)
MKADALLSPYKLGDLDLKNRIVLAPMTRARAGEERVPNDLMTDYYKQRSSAGLLITEATVISESGIGWQNSPGIYNDVQVSGWRQLINGVHEKGGRIFLQLWHCGRASHSSFHEGKLPGAPSAIKLNGDGVYTPTGKKPFETPRALTIDEITQIITEYGLAAKRGMEAGFDGIEIHGANGYLIDQFLQSKTNQRDDIYGGSHENRFRFLKEVVLEVANYVPESRIGVRLSPNGAFNDMGSPDFRESFTYFVAELDRLPVAYLHILDGLKFGFHNLGEPLKIGEFRELFSRTLMANCGYTLASGEEAVKNGSTDLVAYGRPYMSNPDLVERFTNGWPLADVAPMSVWYSFDEKGYADYPKYEG